MQRVTDNTFARFFGDGGHQTFNSCAEAGTPRLGCIVSRQEVNDFHRTFKVLASRKDFG
jgi:hypothetical protein